MNSNINTSKRCEHLCEGKNEVTITCLDCSSQFCTLCYESIHKTDEFKTHKTKPIFKEEIKKEEETSTIKQKNEKLLLKKNSGLLYSCGDNDNGQLCFEDEKERNKLELVKYFNDKEIIQVSVGYDFTILLSSIYLFIFIYLNRKRKVILLW